MAITAENLIHHELNGLEVEVIESSNPGLKGMKGKVVEETKKTIVIENGRIRRIPKENTTFIFQLPDQQRVKIQGKLLLLSPEDRIGRRMRMR